MSLTKYNEKRHFSDTPEPEGKRGQGKHHIFVVQRHLASHLHYDFRLEMEGVLKSWAVPKGPSMNPADKRLAMMVEDHPVSYAGFQGVIPEGNYGAGTVEIWDSGTYELAPANKGTDMEALQTGSLKFIMHGKKLKGAFALVKLKKGAANAWLLVKEKDEEVVTEPYSSEDYLKPGSAPAREVKKATATKATAVATQKTAKAIATKASSRKVQITHPEKEFWPDEHLTKGDLINYYKAVSSYMLPYLKNRPQSMRRNPNGIRDAGFFQKEAGDDLPSFAATASIYSPSSNRDINYLLCNNQSTLLYMANLGCIEINPWNSTIKHLDKPGYAIIDLDPSDKNNFDDVVEAARLIKDLCTKAGINCYPKTSGSEGLHIYIPLGAKYTYDEVLPFAETLATLAVSKAPDAVTTERSIPDRKGKLYIDYMQNQQAQTLASAYSARPKPGATVSAPLDWKEVKKGLHPSRFTIRNMITRIEKKGDLFKPVLGKGIDLPDCLEKLRKL